MGTLNDIDFAFAGDDLVLRLAAAAFPARYTGSSRLHCGSDLRLYFTWCREHELAPLTVARALRHHSSGRRAAQPSGRAVRRRLRGAVWRPIPAALRRSRRGLSGTLWVGAVIREAE